MSNAGLSLQEANAFMALEPRLVALLRAALSGRSPAVHVLTAADLAGVQEAKQATPAVHVVYGGYRIAQDIGRAWRLEHTWHAVAVVRHVAQPSGAAAGRQDAGALATAVALALADARVEGAAEPLALVTPPPPSYAAPFTYLPTTVRAVTLLHKPPM